MNPAIAEQAYFDQAMISDQMVQDQIALMESQFDPMQAYADPMQAHLDSLLAVNTQFDSLSADSGQMSEEGRDALLHHNLVVESLGSGAIVGSMQAVIADTQARQLLEYFFGNDESDDEVQEKPSPANLV